MNKFFFVKIFLSCLLFLFCSTILCVKADNKKTVDASVRGVIVGGKWVAEYDGHSTPVRCTCISALLHNKCVIGDTSTNLSLCE